MKVITKHTTRNYRLILFGIIPIFSMSAEAKENYRKEKRENPLNLRPYFPYVQILFNHQKTKGGLKMTKTYLDSDAKGKRALVSFGTPINAAGNESTVEEGSVKFSSTNEEVATVTPVEGSPYEVNVDFTGKLGSADVVITADADLGNDDNPDTTDDEKIITGLVTFVIEPSMAVGFNANTTISELVDTPATPVVE